MLTDGRSKVKALPFSSIRNKNIRESVTRIDEMIGEDKNAVYMPTPKGSSRQKPWVNNLTIPQFKRLQSIPFIGASIC